MSLIELSGFDIIEGARSASTTTTIAGIKAVTAGHGIITLLTGTKRNDKFRIVASTSYSLVRSDYQGQTNIRDGAA